MEVGDVPRTIKCKGYHAARTRTDPGLTRDRGTFKSRCPAWASDSGIQQSLLDEALVDPDGGTDCWGNPKRLWNAVSNVYFVGVSTNEERPTYNCYPEVPLTALREELARLAERTLAEIAGPETPDE